MKLAVDIPVSGGHLFRPVCLALVCLTVLPKVQAAVIALDFPTSLPILDKSYVGGAIPVLSSDPTYGWFSVSVTQNWIQLENFYSAESGDLVEFLPEGATFGASDEARLGWAQLVFFGSSVPTTNGYLAFKTGTGYYAYADVSWDLASETLTFHSAYLETEVGAGIAMGAVPEPGTMGVALLGVAGCLLRRRRV